MDIGKLFKQKLANREVDASADLFNKIEAKLDASSASNVSTSLNEVATSTLSTAAKVTLISVAAVAITVGGYFVVRSQMQGTTESIVDGTTAEQAIVGSIAGSADMEQAITSTTTDNDTTKTDNPAFTTDFTDQIVISDGSNLKIEFDQAQKNSTGLALQGYEPSIEKVLAKQDIEKVVITDNPVQTTMDRDKHIEKTNLSSKLRIPSFITPNDDGINDYFVIENLNLYPDNVLIILNTSGKQIFSTSHYMNNWNAQSLPSGTYFYKLLLKSGGESEVKTGIIEVIR